MKRLRVGVLYGGRSGEHEVSLASAAAVFANLDRARYEPVPIRIDKDGRWSIAEKPPTAMSAGDVIEQARLDAARPATVDREVHLVARPSGETILSIEAFEAIDCAGMARVDFLLEKSSNRLFLNEVNTIPGFTTISMYSKLWAASGVGYATLLDRLIALAIERHAGKQLLRTSVT